MLLFFLSSGLFLGWSLGANDAANVFGTAVGTRMIKFKVAALIASVAVILGAVLEGAGGTETLGELGAINTLAGAFAVAFAGALTVTVMTKLKLPVSTSQAIVGAIIGWNIFSGSQTDYTSLTKIVGTWVLCPVIAAFFAIVLYYPIKYLLENSKVHMLAMDNYIRIALVIVGAFGSYSLGANNIANVMGVFVASSPFKDISLFGFVHLSSIQILFLLGGLAIAFGIYTYSYKVMLTVGKDLFRLSPVTAFIVVLSHSLVLYIFASQNLSDFLISIKLPPIPLVPVSSSQAVVGAIIGIAIAKGGRNIQFGVLGRISSGWVTTPVISCLVSFMVLFFVQNLFDQKVYETSMHLFSDQVIEKLEAENIDNEIIEGLAGMEFANIRRLNRHLKSLDIKERDIKDLIVEYSTIKEIEVGKLLLERVNTNIIRDIQIDALRKLKGNSYHFEWEFRQALSQTSPSWRFRDDIPENDEYNGELEKQLVYIIEHFSIKRN